MPSFLLGRKRQVLTGLFLALLSVIVLNTDIFALGSPQTPQNGSTGLTATIPSPPPSTGATIVVPVSGQTVTNIPVIVSGICPNGLLIKAFSNNVFIGSTTCINNSYSMRVDLFSGSNKLFVNDYDALNQSGPQSNVVNISYNSAQYSQPSSQVVITSSYGDIGVNPGQQLVWPINVSGGTPPYAINTIWGDGQQSLQSLGVAGSFDLKHTYSTAGTYKITVSVSDSKGVMAFIQFVGIANGQISSSSTTKTKTVVNSQVGGFTDWWIFPIISVVLLVSFWLGMRHGKASLMRKFN